MIAAAATAAVANITLLTVKVPAHVPLA